MQEVRSKLSRWLRPLLFAAGEAGAVASVALRHVNASDKATDIYAAPIHKGFSEADFLGLLTDLDLKIHDDAEGLGGLQRYLVVALDTGGAQLGRCTIRYSVAEEGGDEIDSEPATPKGLISQQMRHTEAIMRTHTMGTAGIIQAQQRTIVRQQETIETLVKDRMESLGTIESLMTEKHRRDMESQQQVFRQKLMADTFDRVKLLLPAVVNRIAGKTVLPERHTPEAMMVRGLVDSMTADQLDSFRSVLKPEQILALTELMQAEAKNQAAEAAASTTSNGNGRS